MKPTVMDLFCGIGGFSKGFEKAGFKILVGIDNWDVALQTFQKNHHESKAINANLIKLRDDFFKSYKNKIDVILAGPPCQGFSMSGKRDENDKRNTLFEEVLRVVRIVLPKIVIIENVVGLLSMTNENGELVRDLIEDNLKKLGYFVESRVMDASEYGVPQSRKRIIFIGSKYKDVKFPDTEKNKVTVGEALSNIPDVGSKEYLQPKNNYQKSMCNKEKQIFNHEEMKHNKEVINRISHVPQGGNWRNIPKKIYNVGGEHSNNYRRLAEHKPSITLKHATKSMIIHPVFDRVITAREVARLQSFSDNFIISGTKFEQHQQLANAVPPLMAFAIGKQIFSALQKDSSLTKEKDKMIEKENKVKFIDLFSGIGGFRLALESVGARCVFSSDTDKWANKTYLLNFGEYPKGDIKKIDTNQIPDHDILCAGFPCQPFSIAGRRKGFSDTRGTLFFEIERILDNKKPIAFILENVKGLITHNKGKTFTTILNRLRALNYVVFYRVLNSSNYGIPQNRERIFIVGFKNKTVSFQFPEVINIKPDVAKILQQNVIGHELSEIAKGHLRRHLNKLNKNSRKVSKTLFATEIRPSRCVFRQDGLSPCLTAKMGTGGNNVPVLVEEERKLTVRECLRIQGFPEHYKMKDNDSQSYKQIGNSVSVPVVTAIAKEIVKQLT